MAVYVVTDPNTGRKVRLTGDTPPTDADLDEIFSSLGQAPAQPQISDVPGPDNKIGMLDAIGSGFVRGVEQVTGGAAQRVAESSKNLYNKRAEELMDKMESGQIEQTPENMQKLDYYISQATRMAVTLNNAGMVEQQKRAEYAPIQEQRPISSTVGNIGGQMAALPIPGIQARLPAQMIKGAAEGALAGGLQSTVADESAASSAKEGALIGGAAPAALRPITQAAGAGYRAIIGSAPEDQASLIRYAKENELPLMTTDVVPPETFAGRGVQALGEKIPVFGTGSQRSAQQEARIAQIKKISDQYGTPSDDEIVQSLREKSNNLALAAGKRYQSIIDDMADTPVTLNSTIGSIDSAIEKYSQKGTIKNDALIKTLQETKESLSEAPQSLALLRQNRTLFREKIKGDSPIIRDTDQKIIDDVYRAMTNDMTMSVAANLGADAAARMRQADAIWAREANEVKKTKIKNILNKGDVKPEEASKMLFSQDKSEVDTLFSALNTKGRENARAAIIQRAFDRSDGSPEKFLSEMQRMKLQTGKFFSGKQGASLNGLVNYLKHTKEASQAAVRTKSGQEMVVPSAIAGAATYAAPQVAAPFISVGIMARAYESEPVRNALVRMASVKPGSTEFEKNAKKLESLLKAAAPRYEEEKQQ